MSPSPAPVAPGTRPAASLLTAVGLGLAVWLALLKWRSLPCLGGGCDAVIQSRYGSLFGVPVGVFGAALWLALVAPLPAAARRAVHAALALGALGFMVVQFGILRAFCPYCTAHAAAAISAWRWRRVRPAWWAVALGVALAGGGYLLAQRAADRAAATATPAATGLAAGADAWWPLAETPIAGPPSGGAVRPVLVVSLTCPACLDLLRELTDAPAPAGRPGPAVYVKAEPRERALAVAWIAACRDLAGNTPRDRFLAVTALLVAQRELVTADPDAAAAWLAGMFHTSPAARAEAEALLARHAARLADSGVATTPWFLPPGGPPRARVTAAEVW